MSKIVYFVVDTNLFHECHALDSPDFPWSGIGEFDVIELLVSAPVQSELDRHRKSTNPRMRRRAIQPVAWFREMLQSGASEHMFQAERPKVIMRLISQTASLDHPELLDLASDDDRIVGIGASLLRSSPSRDIRVLSHDTRPIVKAQAIGLKFAFIPKSWLRAAEVDEREKENARLSAEIAELKSVHPILELTAVGAANNRLRLVREAFSALSEQEAAEIRAQLAQKFSISRIETTFSDYVANLKSNSLGFYKGLVYTAPSEAEVNRYRYQTHPAWLLACFEKAAATPAALNSRKGACASITLENKGYRPAEDVQLTFVVRGPFLIAPAREGGYKQRPGKLPDFPLPPTGYWTDDEGHSLEAVRLDRNHFDPSSMIAPRLDLRPIRREDERWYYEPKMPEEPVTQFTLECRRFRHGCGPYRVDLLVFPRNNDIKSRGSIEVEVSASNVGQKQKKEYVVEVTTNLKSSEELVKSFLEKQRDPIQVALQGMGDLLL